jgi:tetratricopeptide (TPR) repeat protein
MFSIRAIVCVICLLLISSYGVAAEKEYQKLYRHGVEANKKGNLDEAISLYSKAISLKPDSADLYFVRGRAYKMKDQYDSAISDLSKAISLRPSYTEAYNHRGVIYIGKGDTRNALADFTKACKLGNRDACANAVKLTKTK